MRDFQLDPGARSFVNWHSPKCSNATYFKLTDVAYSAALVQKIIGLIHRRHPEIRAHSPAEVLKPLGSEMYDSLKEWTEVWILDYSPTGSLEDHTDILPEDIPPNKCMGYVWTFSMNLGKAGIQLFCADGTGQDCSKTGIGFEAGDYALFPATFFAWHTQAGRS